MSLDPLVHLLPPDWNTENSEKTPTSKNEIQKAEDQAELLRAEVHCG